MAWASASMPVDAVTAGGTLITTDWALKVVQQAFPSTIAPSGGATGDEVVEVDWVDPESVYTRGVVVSGQPIRWWLEGQSYPIRFELDGKSFDATAIGFKQDRVPGATVFFTDRNFVNAIAQNKTMTVFNPAGERVMAIDLKGTAKALDYARDCQNKKL